MNAGVHASTHKTARENKPRSLSVPGQWTVGEGRSGGRAVPVGIKSEGLLKDAAGGRRSGAELVEAKPALRGRGAVDELAEKRKKEYTHGLERRRVAPHAQRWLWQGGRNAAPAARVRHMAFPSPDALLFP